MISLMRGCCIVYLCRSFLPQVVSLLFTFKWRRNFHRNYMYITYAFTSSFIYFQASFKRTINRKKYVNVFASKKQASFIRQRTSLSPNQGAVIFRMKGKCTLLKSALSRQVLKIFLDSKIETRFDFERYNNNNISFICMTICSYSIAKALRLNYKLYQ